MQDEKEKYDSKKLNKIPIHKKMQKLNLKDVMMDFDAASLYPSAGWDEKSVYPKIETGFAFKPHKKNVYVKAFNDQNFIEDGDESAILKVKIFTIHLILYFNSYLLKRKLKKLKSFAQEMDISLTR